MAASSTFCLVFTGILMLLVALPGHRAHGKPEQAFACKFFSGQPGLPSGAPLAQNPGNNQLMRQSMARLHEHLFSRLTEFGVGAAANYSCCNAVCCCLHCLSSRCGPYSFLLSVVGLSWARSPRKSRSWRSFKPFPGHRAQGRARSTGLETKRASLGLPFGASPGTEPWEEPARERKEHCSEHS